MRLTRSIDRNWSLEFSDTTIPEISHRIGVGEFNIVLKLLEQTQARRLIIDLTTTRDFDSRGVQLLVMLHKQCTPKNIPVVLCNPCPHLRRVMRVMQLERMFEIEFDENYIEMK